MDSPIRTIAVGVMCGLLLAGQGGSAEPNDAPADPSTAKAAVIVCEGMIDDGLFKSIQRRTQLALEQDVKYLIYEIGTYGGLVQSADDISKYFILDIGKKADTVAYITTEAISAGAIISVSCRDIVMRENTTIGDAAPIMLGGKLEGVEREKTESFVRSMFERAAEANDYPVALLKAMVTVQEKVYRVENLETGKYEFFEEQELPDDPNRYGLDDKELIIDSDKLLTLTASQALEYGVARAVGENRQGALDFLAERDGVTFADEPMVLHTTWSEEMVRWLNSPGVMAVLVLIAMLGVYIEFNTPGLGLPGLAAVICFVIIVGSKYLTGLANWIEVAVFLLGILLLLVEIFVLPGFGIAGISGLICIVAGIFGMLIRNAPDELPWPRNEFAWNDFTWGVIGLALGFVGFIIFAWLFSKYLPKLQFLSGLTLVPTSSAKGAQMPISMTAAPDSAGKGVKIGDTGEVLSTLRPTGKVKFADAIVDVVALAEFIERGSKVEIVEIHGNRVVVRAVPEEL
jgi:membrane-bound serine protease (ClpP class)